MIARLLITLALAGAPLSAAAVSIPPPPHCVEDGVKYFDADPLAEGIVYTESYEGTELGEAHNWLVSCSSGQGVRATYVGDFQIDFYTLSARLAQSSEIYTLQDVAKLAREAGWDARVMPFPASCVCDVERSE